MKDYMNSIAVINEVKKAVIGKDECIVKTMCALLAGGHILIEDIPGVGKTTMAMAFAKAMQMESKRMQFTPDVMPSDIVGFKLYRQNTGEFEYQPGAAMCNLFLADEINRTSPKTQSALLEVMEEGRLSVEGEVYELPKPFLVIATENPFGSAGTQRLPESQLDRFLICLSMGYPSIEEELDIVRGKCNTIPIEDIRPVIDRAQVRELQRQVSLVHIDNKVYDYIGRLVTETRQSQEIALGLSPRGTIALAKMAQAMAYVTGRLYVIPEDVACIFSDVAAHRIRMRAAGQDGVEIRKGICRNILERVEKPAVLA
ncbi:MAG: MoxR family ATPase [Lachnospiraceae bacterium]|nr:MoxR family ATPase [Lachnospiraceae bacterium]